MEQIFDEKFIAKFAPLFVKKIVEQSSGILSKVGVEAETFFSDSLNQYCVKQLLHHSQIKTLLYRNQPRHFYDVYFPLSLSLEKQVFKTDSVSQLFQYGACITVMGSAGSGKSTLVKHLFLNTILEQYAIPIIIEFRNFNDFEGTFQEYISQQISGKKMAKSQQVIQRLLENGRFVLFLDGFDEVDTDKKGHVVNDLKAFVEEYSLNRYLMTSRPQAGIELFPNFINLKVSDLIEEEIEAFVDQQEIAEQLKSKIIKSITESENKHLIEEFLSNPLLLTLYIITYSHYPEVPPKKSTFYKRVFDVLCYEHDAETKTGYQHERLAKIDQEKMEEVLKLFSLLSFFDRKYEFDLDYINKSLQEIKFYLNIDFDNRDFKSDMVTAISIWVEDSGVCEFAHRSLQEYFTVFAIARYEGQKEEIYKKVKHRLSSTSFVNIQNFMDLCIEMDEIDFIKYVKLPFLKKIYGATKNTANVDKIKYLLELKEDMFLSLDEGIPIANGMTLLIECSGTQICIGLSEEMIKKSIDEMVEKKNFYYIFQHYNQDKNDYFCTEFSNNPKACNLMEEYLNTVNSTIQEFLVKIDEHDKFQNKILERLI